MIVIIVIVIVTIIVIVSKRVVIVAIIVIPIVSIIIVVVVIPWLAPTVRCHVTPGSVVVAIFIYLSIRSSIPLVGPSVLIILWQRLVPWSLLVSIILLRWGCLVRLVQRWYPICFGCIVDRGWILLWWRYRIVYLAGGLSDDKLC